jgi:hypothetical protein
MNTTADNTVTGPDHHVAVAIARRVCVYLDHDDYMVAAPVATDAAYVSLAKNTDHPRRQIIATAAATTAAAKALDAEVAA